MKAERVERAALLQAARDAAQSAYCPYSGFHVGASVLAHGSIFRGSNVENASYGLTVCAERVAIFAAIAAGAREISALAVTCPDATAKSSRMPCGACRQVIAEFASKDFILHVDGVGDFRLNDLIPNAFTLK